MSLDTGDRPFIDRHDPVKKRTNAGSFFSKAFLERLGSWGKGRVVEVGDTSGMALVQNLTPDLFETPVGQGSLAEFMAAFESWLAQAQMAQRVRRQSSRDVYEDIWQAFVRWCLSQAPVVGLDHITESHLEQFLLSRKGSGQVGELTDRYARRVLDLVDQVLTHRAVVLGAVHNDAAKRLIRATPRLRTANLQAAPLPDYLPADEARQLVQYLGEAIPKGAAECATARGPWQELRNRTAVALHLGAGVTPGEVRALALDAPIVDGARRTGVPWKLVVPADGQRAQREAPVAPWAGALLRHWLAVRETIGFASDPAAGATQQWLFPSTRNGKQWGKVAHYEAVKSVLAAAAIFPTEGGAFRLRHTFAMRQLRRGTSVEELARWLGIQNPAELERYRRVVPRPQDVA